MDKTNDELFIELCKSKEEFLLFLFQENVFQTKNGKVILNFDKHGALVNIEKRQRINKLLDKDF